MFLGIDHVQIAAPPGCEVEGRRFFGDLLGLTELPKPPALAARGGLWFRCGAQEIHIGVEKDFRAAKKAHPAFRLIDEKAFDALRTRLQSAAIATREGPEVQDVARFFVDDPLGQSARVCRNESKVHCHPAEPPLDHELPNQSTPRDAASIALRLCCDSHILRVWQPFVGYGPEWLVNIRGVVALLGLVVVRVERFHVQQWVLRWRVVERSVVERSVVERSVVERSVVERSVVERGWR